MQCFYSPFDPRRAPAGRFVVMHERQRFARGWAALQALAADGLVGFSCVQGDASLRVTAEGRWLIRTIAEVFDPQQRQRASYDRLL